MALTPGTRVGPYEVVSALGAGGMGEVYRARDSRLGRDVAIKVLPAGLSADPERLQRFEQEARAAAALNHPNILALYDIGTHDGVPYLVTELLAGETLRERIARGPLPQRKATEYATQIATGLAAAHEKGITHRDLKPDNVFVSVSGHVKILDFGLAKLVGPAEAGQPEVTTLRTTPPGTSPGIVLGTVGYMAPEQVKGLPADHRSDIFAFGATLYEMLAGRRAFHRDSAPETMTAILNEEPPDLTTSLQAISPALDRIVRRCLEKNPSARFQSAHDLAFALEALETASSGTVARVAGAGRRVTRERLLWAVAATSLLLAGLGAGALWLRRPDAIPPVVTFVASDGVSTSFQPAVSPDGTRIVFVADRPGGESLIYVRALDSATAQPLTGTEAAVRPFWSPDSRWLAFFAGGKLKKVDLLGGAPVTLTDALARGGSWNADDLILFGGPPSSGLLQIPASGGTPRPATLDTNTNGHANPHFLPDGRHFLYSAFERAEGSANGTRVLYAASLDSTTDRKLLLTLGTDAGNAQYARGYLFVARAAGLMAYRFDAEQLVASEDGVRLGVDAVEQGGRPYGNFSVSERGVLAYQVARTAGNQRLEWLDRAGRQLSVVGAPGAYSNTELSPDGRRLAVSLLDPRTQTRDIWTIDLARGVRTRFTFDATDERSMAWSPDGGRLTYNVGVPGRFDLYQKAANGAGGIEALLEDGLSKDPMTWSPDGRQLLYRVSGPTGNDIWALSATGERKPYSFLSTPFEENYARFSPDGRWLAYASNESGREEIYVTAFPGGGKWQVSSEGGSFPRWRGDGSELYYLAADSSLMAVSIDGKGASFEIGNAQRLFQARPPAQAGHPYVVTPDGQRFLFITETSVSTPLTVIVNWPSLLTQ